MWGLNLFLETIYLITQTELLSKWFFSAQKWNNVYQGHNKKYAASLVDVMKTQSIRLDCMHKDALLYWRLLLKLKGKMWQRKLSVGHKHCVPCDSQVLKERKNRCSIDSIWRHYVKFNAPRSLKLDLIIIKTIGTKLIHSVKLSNWKNEWA